MFVNKALMLLSVFMLVIAFSFYSQNSHSYLNDDGVACVTTSPSSVRNPLSSGSSYEWKPPYGSVVDICEYPNFGVKYSGVFVKNYASKTFVQCPSIEVCSDGSKDEPEDECPSSEQFYKDANGVCKNIDDNCEIGSGISADGQSCEPDDCASGQYSSPISGSCKDIPCPSGQVRNLGICTTPLPDPDPDPDPDTGGGGDPDPDTGGGGGGGDPDPDPDTGTTPTCASYSDCRAAALEASNYKEDDRDHFIYQYIGPDDYAAECDTCEGPNYLAYSECQDNACTFGYDAVSNRCYTLSCPFGDCADPNGDGSLDPIPLPTNPDNSDERLSEVIDAVNSVRDSIENNETPEKIEELKEELTNTLESNKDAIIEQLAENNTSNNSDNEGLLKKLEEIEENTRNSGEPSDGKDYTQVLNDLLENSDDALCELDPARAGCDPIEETTVDTHAAADALMDGLQESGIYSALAEFKDISITVSSACPASFRFQLTFIGTYTLDVCSVFEPIVPLLRALFIAFWGLVSFRALTDA